MFLKESPYIRFLPNPITDPLINHWTTIRDQLWGYLTILGSRNGTGWVDQHLAKPNNANTDHFKQPLYHGRFDGFSMMLRGTLLDRTEKAHIGWQDHETLRWNPNRWIEKMPFMTDYVTKHLEYLGSVTFNTSHPGSMLNHHWGLDHQYLRLHLCLDSAEGCVFDIEGWKHEWVNGELFGFDDANVLHGTSHTGNKSRTIMIVDVLKDQLKPYAMSWPCRPNRPAREHWSSLRISKLLTNNDQSDI